MKKILILLSITGLMILSAAETKQVSYKINGMTCQGCVNKVNKVLDNTVGIEKYEVNLKKGEAVVFYDPEVTVEENIQIAIGSTPFACQRMTVKEKVEKKSFLAKIKSLFK